jgi:hypothetical protein
MGYIGWISDHDSRPLQNTPFCLPPQAGCQAQILTRLRRINPQNTQCMDACPDLIGVVNPAIASRYKRD